MDDVIFAEQISLRERSSRSAADLCQQLFFLPLIITIPACIALHAFSFRIISDSFLLFRMSSRLSSFSIRFILSNVPFRLQIFSRFSFSIRFSRYGLLRISAFRLPSSGDGEIRTLDPLLARQVLSQLSYAPILAASSSAFGPSSATGLKWTRTTDLTLIRRAL